MNVNDKGNSFGAMVGNNTNPRFQGGNWKQAM